MPGKDCVLLVEGPDDKHVVRHLSNLHEEMPEFCVLNKEGINNLLQDIGLEILVSGRKAVGILVDANDDLNARWSAVSGRLREEGIEMSGSPKAGGTIQEGSPRIGIWLMPDNRSAGELEDFVSQMIPDGDPVWPLAQGYIDGIPAAHRKFTGKKIQRAKLHAWLATREDPRLMGVAIRSGDLRVDRNLSTKFADWLRQLFE